MTVDTRILLRAREAAEMLEICEKTLWNLTAPRGPIPFVRIGPSGRSVRYLPETLQRFAKQQQEQSLELVTA